MWLRLLCLLLPLQMMAAPVPSLHEGRFRPLECTARLWLYDLHHRQAVKGGPGAEDLLWDLHFHGHAAWDDEPLFWLHLAELKGLLGLEERRDRFSYNELQAALDSQEFWKLLATQEYFQLYFSPVNRSRAEMLELAGLAPGVWAAFENDALVLLKTGDWGRLAPGTLLHEQGRQLSPADLKKRQGVVNEALDLMQKLSRYEAFIAPETFSREFSSLAQAGNDMRLLPDKHAAGEWVSLRALRYNIPNFTPYPDTAFTAMRKAYLAENVSDLKQLLSENYPLLAGQSYRKARGKQLNYPTELQLQAESAYYRYPLVEVSIVLYLLGALLLLLGRQGWGIGCLGLGFLLHSSVLAMRCYILQRPPVSNMFETVIYVPWVTMLASFVFTRFSRGPLLLSAGAIASVALLLLLRLTNVNSGMENVQAVLDSQYWLTVHVLMIVASYGVFVLCGVLAHLYLLSEKRGLERSIVQTMYLGTALLIPATILGGVWAAESWGRFWDWDPKESWAFISSCVYLIGIHLYRYKRVGPRGLAAVAVIGLMSISFTWYGVNYILGTGLHSYGFGSGGELYYYLYLVAECLFLAAVLLRGNRHRSLT